jgi:dipeptidyl aminopeptidase/acylaminoacyl peptidase
MATNSYQLLPFVPHLHSEVKDGVFPSAVGEEVYEGWVKKFQRLDDISAHRLVYQSDEHIVTGLYLKPVVARAGEHPIILFNRGGRNRYGMLNVLTINNLLYPLVAAGYTVYASNYRGVDGGTGEDEFGGAEVQDIVELAAIARNDTLWDQRNLYMFGWSRGGMMTLLAQKHGVEANAIALGAPLVDLTLNRAKWDNAENEAWITRVVPDYAANGGQALVQRSATYWPEKLSAPSLLMHGTADDDVSIEHSRLLARKLDEHEIPNKLIEYPGGNHYLNKEREQVMDAILCWFDSYRR